MKKAFQELIKLTNDEVVEIKTCNAGLINPMVAISVVAAISITATQEIKDRLH